MLKIKQSEINAWLERLLKDLLKGENEVYRLYLSEFKGEASITPTIGYCRRGIELMCIHGDYDLQDMLGELTDELSEQDIINKFRQYIVTELFETFSFYPHRMLVEEEKTQIFTAMYEAFASNMEEFEDWPLFLRRTDNMDFVLC